MNHFVTAKGLKSRAALARLVLGAAAAVAGFSAANAATPAGDVPAIVVRYDQQALRTDVGAADVYRRIVRAARRVCDTESNRDLRAVARANACREQAIARAVVEIHDPRLAAVYAGRSKNG